MQAELADQVDRVPEIFPGRLYKDSKIIGDYEKAAGYKFVKWEKCSISLASCIKIHIPQHQSRVETSVLTHALDSCFEMCSMCARA